MIQFSNTSGSNNRTAKFTEDQVREIRRICDGVPAEKRTAVHKELGRRFGVHYMTICNVDRRKTYYSVTP